MWTCILRTSPRRAWLTLSMALETAWRRPEALDSFVISSMRPGINGRPSGSYEGSLGSLDWPCWAM